MIKTKVPVQKGKINPHKPMGDQMRTYDALVKERQQEIGHRKSGQTPEIKSPRK